MKSMVVKESVFVKEMNVYVDRLEDYIDFFGTPYLFRMRGNGLPKGYSRYTFIDPDSYYIEIDGMWTSVATLLKKHSKTIMLGL